MGIEQLERLESSWYLESRVLDREVYWIKAHTDSFTYLLLGKIVVGASYINYRSRIISSLRGESILIKNLLCIFITTARRWGCIRLHRLKQNVYPGGGEKKKLRLSYLIN